MSCSLFKSLIHTCQLCGANSFDHLVELQRHAQELAASSGALTPALDSVLPSIPEGFRPASVRLGLWKTDVNHDESRRCNFPPSGPARTQGQQCC